MNENPSADHNKQEAQRDELPATPPADILDPKCPSRTVLRHLTDRWTPMIVTAISSGEPRRFTDLKKTVGGISPKVLTETLRSMERDGLITRHVTPSIPPRVDYQLTDLGLTLINPIASLRRWAEEHVDDVQRNRGHFDKGTHRP